MTQTAAFSCLTNPRPSQKAVLWLQGTPVRIIALTSIAHQWGSLYLDLNDLHWRHREYDPVGGYASSKLANVLFIRTLATRSYPGSKPSRPFLPWWCFCGH